MFVRSRMQKEVTYRKNGSEWVLKPGQTVVIDDSKVSATELLKLYGTRIEVISREKLSVLEEKIPVKFEIKKEVKAEPIKADLKNEKLIDDILTKIASETKKEEKAGEIKKAEGLEIKKAEGLEIKEENNENAGKLKVEKDVVGDLALTPVEDGKGEELVKNEEKKEESASGEIKKADNKEAKQRKPRARKVDKVAKSKKRTRKAKATN